MQDWDFALFHTINRGWANPVFDWLMPFISNANKAVWFWVLVVCFVGFLLWRGPTRNRWFVLVLALAIGLTNEATDFLKAMTNVPRPPEALGAVRLPPGIEPLGSNGFPSAHSANMMAMALTITLFWPRKAWPVLIVPILTGYSRIYLGAHFPHQVLAGYATGAMVSLALSMPFLWAWRRAGSASAQPPAEPAEIAT